jgi:hypothetical protein
MFGAQFGFSLQNLTVFLVSSVAVWLSIPWVALDVYANSIERNPTNLEMRVRGVKLAWILAAALFLYVATWLGRTYLSLAFWMLVGATASCYFSKMLISAYERGRTARDREGGGSA